MSLSQTFSNQFGWVAGLLLVVAWCFFELLRQRSTIAIIVVTAIIMIVVIGIGIAVLFVIVFIISGIILTDMVISIDLSDFYDFSWY